MKAYKTKRGHWQVNFTERGKQRILYLGKDYDAGSANRIARIVTDILVYRKRGEPLPADVLRRLDDLPDRLRQNFECKGLSGDKTSRTLDGLLSAFYESKSHLKAGTQSNYKCTGAKLLKFFGKGKKLDSIKSSDCEVFKTKFLKAYSASSVSRIIRYCRTIFGFAVESALLSKNPFAGVKSSVEVNEERLVYVDVDTTHKVMACCRDDHDRLFFALARFAGLRVPSEVRHLRYSDFTENTIRIHADTKTGKREVPLFCEVRKIVDRIKASLGDKYNSAALVFPKVGGFRRRILQAIKKSGVKCWTKLFVNLRSSCITDFSERGYAEKTMDAIFGNSAAVRLRHYIQFRKEREYAKVLQDDARLHEESQSNQDGDLLKTFRESIMNSSLSAQEIDRISVLLNLILTRFGCGGARVN
jgi:integrase